MKCLRCGNDKTTKYGLKKGLTIKQRWYCHNCRHLFYTPMKGDKPVSKVKVRRTVSSKTAAKYLRRKQIGDIVRSEIDESTEVKD
jgi:transposase-like protein